jgi:hypothetical protein
VNASKILNCLFKNRFLSDNLNFRQLAAIKQSQVLGLSKLACFIGRTSLNVNGNRMCYIAFFVQSNGASTINFYDGN